MGLGVVEWVVRQCSRESGGMKFLNLENLSGKFSTIASRCPQT